MLEKEITASHIEVFLDRLLDRFEVLNENQRVPFYETAHEKYKFKQDLLKKYQEREQKLLKQKQNESFRSKRKARGTSFRGTVPA